MKYESNILKRLIDTYGVVGNPRYISEIIKEFIVQGKERFPELFTYQADWLAHIDEFGLNPSYTVSYTGQSIYAPNTLERPVKSAILKGNTLLVDELGNECEIPNSPKITMGAWINTNTGVETASVTSFNTGFLKCPTVPFVVKGNNKYKRIVFYDENKTFISGIDTNVSNNSDVTIASTKIPSNAFYLRISASNNTEGVSYTPDTKLLIEDVSGNNLYSTQLVSVKMPVLTTTGKNLFDGKLENGAIVSNTGVNTPSTDNVRSIGYIKVNANASIVISNDLNYSNNIIYEYDANKNYIGRKNTNPFTTSENCRYIRFRSDTNQPNLNVKYQIEYGTKATSYEPFKSNILTVNEDVTLRSNGDICDELNLLTGQLTQRIDEDGEVLSQESVKTVDLTILDQNGQNVKQLMSFNGGTHFNTTSLEGSPLPTVSVSVETDLEEILLMCSLEGNTL